MSEGAWWVDEGALRTSGAAVWCQFRHSGGGPAFLRAVDPATLVPAARAALRGTAAWRAHAEAQAALAEAEAEAARLKALVGGGRGLAGLAEAGQARAALLVLQERLPALQEAAGRARHWASVELPLALGAALGAAPRQRRPRAEVLGDLCRAAAPYLSELARQGGGVDVQGLRRLVEALLDEASDEPDAEPSPEPAPQPAAPAAPPEATAPCPEALPVAAPADAPWPVRGSARRAQANGGGQPQAAEALPEGA